MLGPLLLMGVLTLQSPAPRTTLTPDMQRAQQHDRAGWTRVDAKDFGGAAREFEAALQVYPEYADALHGLGKSRMALKQYDAAARALERCRDSYAHAGTEDAEHRLLANRARENQLATLRRRLADLEAPSTGSSRGGGPSSSTEVLEIKQQIREIQAEREPGPVTGKPAPVPAFVSLALGSAYFRLDRLPDAEREFRAALAVEPKFGEAHSNLALVCLLTGRAKEAEEHVRVAEEAKFTVNPELKRQIREALRKT
ncbi:MAG TPA: tetratricopeptide repeat protein [Vicinamibacterales bacterium]